MREEREVREREGRQRGVRTAMKAQSGAGVSRMVRKLTGDEVEG